MEIPGRTICFQEQRGRLAKRFALPDPLAEKQKREDEEKARFRLLASRKTTEYLRMSGELRKIMDSVLGIENGECGGRRRPALRVVAQGRAFSRTIQKKELLEGMLEVMNEVCIEAEVPRAARIYSLIDNKCPGIVKEPENALELETLREALRIMVEAKEFLEVVEQGVFFDIEAEEYENLVVSIYQMKRALSEGAPGKWENIMIKALRAELGEEIWKNIFGEVADGGAQEVWVSVGELFQAFEKSMLCEATYFTEDGEEKINIWVPDWREFYGREKELRNARSFAYRMNMLFELNQKFD